MAPNCAQLETDVNDNDDAPELDASSDEEFMYDTSAPPPWSTMPAIPVYHMVENPDRSHMWVSNTAFKFKLLVGCWHKNRGLPLPPDVANSDQAVEQLVITCAECVGCHKFKHWLLFPIFSQAIARQGLAQALHQKEHTLESSIHDPGRMLCKMCAKWTDDETPMTYLFKLQALGVINIRTSMHIQIGGPNIGLVHDRLDIQMHEVCSWSMGSLWTDLATRMNAMFDEMPREMDTVNHSLSTSSARASASTD